LREEVGKQVADELVRRCLQVSSATHPPCNAQNSCKLMEDEFSEDADCWARMRRHFVVRKNERPANRQLKWDLRLATEFLAVRSLHRALTR